MDILTIKGWQPPHVLHQGTQAEGTGEATDEGRARHDAVPWVPNDPGRTHWGKPTFFMADLNKDILVNNMMIEAY